jgi:hypothetical protein
MAYVDKDGYWVEEYFGEIPIMVDAQGRRVLVDSFRIASWPSIRREDLLRLRVTPMCCSLHNMHCEPPGELCCANCAEWHHGLHADWPNGLTLSSHHDGSRCVLPHE